MKTALIWMLTCALLGIVAASFIVPPALSWYAEPGGAPGQGVQSLVQIPEVMRYTTEKLLRGQFIGGVLGAIVGLVLAIMMRRRREVVTAHPPPPSNVNRSQPPANL